MKVYVDTNDNSRAIQRVVQALKAHAPKKVQFVGYPQLADLVVLHVIGRRDRMMRQAEQLKADGKSYAVIQYALRSTKTPKTADWQPLWKDAQIIWSYLPIHKWWLSEFEGVGRFEQASNLYHAPLGVDAKVFKPKTVTKFFAIATVGTDWLTQSVRECALAAQVANRKAVHIGSDLGNRGPGIASYTGISDEAVAQLYSDSDFVSGLRRIEGFELPAAEGLLCGARPILFDQPHYRDWYGDWAEYIPEGPREQVIDLLGALFKSQPRKVTPKERAAAKEKFDWKKIISEFWKRVL